MTHPIVPYGYGSNTRADTDSFVTGWTDAGLHPGTKVWRALSEAASEPVIGSLTEGGFLAEWVLAFEFLASVEMMCVNNENLGGCDIA